MGEIGISPHEFLYELSYWEVLRIIRGYRRRGRLRDQLIANAVFAAMYAMRDAKGMTPARLFPMLFEDPDDDIDNEITDEEIAFFESEERAYAQNLMDNFNGQQHPAPPKESSPEPEQPQPAEPAK